MLRFLHARPSARVPLLVTFAVFAAIWDPTLALSRRASSWQVTDAAWFNVSKHLLQNSFGHLEAPATSGQAIGPMNTWILNLLLSISGINIHTPAWMSAKKAVELHAACYKNEIWTQFAACSIYNWHDVKMDQNGWIWTQDILNLEIVRSFQDIHLRIVFTLNSCELWKPTIHLTFQKCPNLHYEQSHRSPRFNPGKPLGTEIPQRLLWQQLLLSSPPWTPRPRPWRPFREISSKQTTEVPGTCCKLRCLTVKWLAING